MMQCCTPMKQRIFTISIGTLLILFGTLLVVFSGKIVQDILDKELSLANDKTVEYSMWKETPIPMYTEMYLFNWTNYEEVQNDWSIKPVIVECGPYTYSEHHIREEIIFNNNNTITYKTKRIWHFLPDKSIGSLDDQITTINPILVTIGYFVRFKHLIVQMGLNFFLEEFRYNLTVTKSAKEFLFDGYDDPMIDLAHKLNMSSFNIPFDKFGWFYSRNGSVDYDGSFNMYTGADNLNKLGRFTQWNGKSRTNFYSDGCGMVNGTSGELWYPVGDDEGVEIFAPDLCSTLSLEKESTYTAHGIEGYMFIATAKNFDNGTTYPDMQCFSPGISVPSGVRNISQCKFSAPAFVSYPHYYLSDPFYAAQVDGIRPNKTKHAFLMAIEPKTGIPLKVQAAMQANLWIPRIEGIKLLKNVEPIFLPVLWFRELAELDEGLAKQAKVLLILPNALEYTGYGVLGIGCLLIILGLYIIFWKRWREDEERLVTQ